MSRTCTAHEKPEMLILLGSEINYRKFVFRRLPKESGLSLQWHLHCRDFSSTVVAQLHKSVRARLFKIKHLASRCF